MDHVGPKPHHSAFEAQVKRIAENIAGIMFVKRNGAQIAIFDHQPAEMSPYRRDQGTMRVGLLVGVLMMLAVYRHPSRGRILQAANAQQREKMFEPFGAGESAVSEQPVIAERHSQHAKKIMSGDEQHEARPTE